MARAEQTRPTSLPTSRPEVIVDFTLREGGLTIHLKNVGARPAYQVKTVFDKPFCGLGGEKEISALRIFRKLDFIAPAKELSQFVDVISSYVRRKQPLTIAATLSYRDGDGVRYSDRIVHDLRSYLELGEVSCADSRTQRGEHGTS